MFCSLIYTKKNMKCVSKPSSESMFTNLTNMCFVILFYFYFLQSDSRYSSLNGQIKCQVVFFFFLFSTWHACNRIPSIHYWSSNTLIFAHCFIIYRTVRHDVFSSEWEIESAVLGTRYSLWAQHHSKMSLWTWAEQRYNFQFCVLSFYTDSYSQSF